MNVVRGYVGGGSVLPAIGEAARDHGRLAVGIPIENTNGVAKPEDLRLAAPVPALPTVLVDEAADERRERRVDGEPNARPPRLVIGDDVGAEGAVAVDLRGELTRGGERQRLTDRRLADQLAARHTVGTEDDLAGAARRWRNLIPNDFDPEAATMGRAERAPPSRTERGRPSGRGSMRRIGRR